MKIDFEFIEKEGLLLYKYIRGSKLYGLSRPESDIDYGGIYIEPLNSLLSITPFPDHVCDETNDQTWYSLGKFAQLLYSSNPNILEALFIPEDLVIYKHSLIDKILEYRDRFVTKRCFHSFIGYATGQIERARSLKKKITCPIDGPLKPCLEYVMYSEGGGSKRVVDFLEKHQLYQEYCGLVSLDKMRGCYAMYYDWSAHFQREGVSLEEGTEENYQGRLCGWYDLVISGYDLSEVPHIDFQDWIKKYKDSGPFGYRGLVVQASNQVRLSSIPKGEVPLLSVVYYDSDSYSSYCKQWGEYNDFKKHHNEERFNLAKEKQFDRKNACHSIRLLNMGVEIARGEGVKLDRTNIDRDFLMRVREGNSTFEEIMEYLENKKKEMTEAMDNSTIPDQIDLDLLNDIIIGIRKEFYKV